LDGGAALAFDEDLDGAVGEAQELDDGADGAGPEDVVGGGVVGLGFFWAVMRISLSLFMASARALMDFSRPTKRGTTMWGKTMMSRRGSRGLPTAGASGGSCRLKKAIALTRFLIDPGRVSGERLARAGGALGVGGGRGGVQAESRSAWR
jgi:hypothetical protein